MDMLAAAAPRTLVENTHVPLQCKATPASAQPVPTTP